MSDDELKPKYCRCITIHTEVTQSLKHTFSIPFKEINLRNNVSVI